MQKAASFSRGLRSGVQALHTDVGVRGAVSDFILSCEKRKFGFFVRDKLRSPR
jgi:hypothetical protein